MLMKRDRCHHQVVLKQMLDMVGGGGDAFVGEMQRANSDGLKPKHPINTPYMHNNVLRAVSRKTLSLTLIGCTREDRGNRVYLQSRKTKVYTSLSWRKKQCNARLVFVVLLVP